MDEEGSNAMATLIEKKNPKDVSRRIREIVEKNRSIRAKVSVSFYDPMKQTYCGVRGESVLFESPSAAFVLELPTRIKEMIASAEKGRE